MAFFDLPLDELRHYKPDVREPSDFDDFWVETLRANPSSSEPLEMVRTAEHLTSMEIFDVTTRGYAGQPIKAWYLRPKTAEEALPTVVSYIGYGGGRGLPEEHLAWAAAGFAQLVVDSRGQGGSWGSGGDTADQGTFVSAAPGSMTRGIEDKNNYYFRRIYTDAANAVETARGLDGVDPDRIITAGGSQAGGLAIAAAALDTLRSRGERAPIGTIANVPFLGHFERAVGLTDAHPYREIVDYLATRRDMVPTVFETLSYFDGVNMAKRIRGEGLYSVGLMDVVVPPSTVFASYNWFGGHADIEVYPFNGHEGGGSYQGRTEILWAQSLVASS